MDRTGSKTDTPAAQSGSRPVLYELVSHRGEIFGPYTSREEAAEAARTKWGTSLQDDDPPGDSWDIQVVGADKR